MPFPFVYICDILDRLERPHLRDVPYLPMHFKSSTRDMTIEWFKLHRHQLNHFNTSDEAVLWMLQPEKQIDRIYGLNSGRLELIIARALSLPQEHYFELQAWRNGPLKGDLALCVSRVMENYKTLTFRSETNKVTVEEIDQALLRIAAFNNESSEAVQSLAQNWTRPDEVQLLGRLYMKLQGREAKWLTRIILKDYGPVKFPKDLALGSNHSSLPNCLNVSIQLSTPSSSAVRLEGAGVVRGASAASAAGPANPPKPTTVPTLPLISQPSTTAFPPTPPTSTRQLSSPTLASSKRRRLSCLSSSAPEPTSSLPALLKSGRCALAPLSSNSQNPQQRKSPKIHTPTVTRRSVALLGSGFCQVSAQSCLLRHYIFLLSPCISNSRYITNTLLSWHGSRYVTSLSSFQSNDLPKCCSTTGKRYSKIVLVESHHAKKTVDFLKKIMKIKSKHRKEWEKVQVYDWRLLESISKAETGKRLTHDPWRRLWMLDI